MSVCQNNIQLTLIHPCRRVRYKDCRLCLHSYILYICFWCVLCTHHVNTYVIIINSPAISVYSFKIWKQIHLSGGNWLNQKVHINQEWIWLCSEVKFNPCHSGMGLHKDGAQEWLNQSAMWTNVCLYLNFVCSILSLPLPPAFVKKSYFHFKW